MNLNKLAAFALAISGTAVLAQPASSPAFTAFQKFCANPNMTPQTIRVAVESAGGTVFIPEQKTAFPFQTSTTSWHAVVMAHEFLVNVIDGHVPVGSSKVQEFFTCTVTDEVRTGDEAAKSEMKRWVGFPPDSSLLGMESYHLEWDGQRRTPAPANSDADSEAGKVWRVTASNLGGMTLLRLERSLRATSK